MPTVGTCGNCGGPVQTPDLWGGMLPPTPTCARCGAIAATPYGPVIPMTAPPDNIETLGAMIRTAAKLTPNDRVDGPPAASLRAVRSHDELEGNAK